MAESASPQDAGRSAATTPSPQRCRSSVKDGALLSAPAPDKGRLSPAPQSISCDAVRNINFRDEPKPLQLPEKPDQTARVLNEAAQRLIAANLGSSQQVGRRLPRPALAAQALRGLRRGRGNRAADFDSSLLWAEDEDAKQQRAKQSSDFDRLASATQRLIRDAVSTQKENRAKASEIELRAAGAVTELVTHGEAGLPTLAPVAGAMQEALRSAEAKGVTPLPDELCSLHGGITSMHVGNVEVDDGSEDEAEFQGRTYDALFPRTRPCRLRGPEMFSSEDFTDLSLPIFALVNSRDQVLSLFRSIKRFLDLFRQGEVDRGWDKLCREHRSTKEELERAREQLDRIIQEHASLRADVKVAGKMVRRRASRSVTGSSNLGSPTAGFSSEGPSPRARPPSPADPDLPPSPKWVQTDAVTFADDLQASQGSVASGPPVTLSQLSSPSGKVGRGRSLRKMMMQATAAQGPRKGSQAGGTGGGTISPYGRRAATADVGLQTETPEGSNRGPDSPLGTRQVSRSSSVACPSPSASPRAGSAVDAARPYPKSPAASELDAQGGRGLGAQPSFKQPSFVSEEDAPAERDDTGGPPPPPVLAAGSPQEEKAAVALQYLLAPQQQARSSSMSASLSSAQLGSAAVPDVRELRERWNRVAPVRRMVQVQSRRLQARGRYVEREEAQDDGNTEVLLTMLQRLMSRSSELSEQLQQIAAARHRAPASVAVRLGPSPGLNFETPAPRPALYHWIERREHIYTQACEFFTEFWDQEGAAPAAKPSTYVAVHIKGLRRLVEQDPTTAALGLRALADMMQLPAPPLAGTVLSRKGDMMVAYFTEGSRSKEAPSAAFAWLVSLQVSVHECDWGPRVGAEPIRLGCGLGGSANGAAELARLAAPGNVLVSQEAYKVVADGERTLCSEGLVGCYLGGHPRDVHWCSPHRGGGSPAPRLGKKEDKLRGPPAWSDPAGHLDAHITWLGRMRDEAKQLDTAARRKSKERPGLKGDHASNASRSSIGSRSEPAGAGKEQAVAVVDIHGIDRAWDAAAALAFAGDTEAAEELMAALSKVSRALRTALQMEQGWEIWSGGDCWVVGLPGGVAAARWAVMAQEKSELLRDSWPKDLFNAEGLHPGGVHTAEAAALRVGVVLTTATLAATAEGMDSRAAATAALLCSAAKPGAWSLGSAALAEHCKEAQLGSVDLGVLWCAPLHEHVAVHALTTKQKGGSKPSRTRSTAALGPGQKGSARKSPKHGPKAGGAAAADGGVADLLRLHKRTRVFAELVERCSRAARYGPEEGEEGRPPAGELLLFLWSRCVANPIDPPEAFSPWEVLDTPVAGANLDEAADAVHDAAKVVINDDRQEKDTSNMLAGVSVLARSLVGHLSRAIWAVAQMSPLADLGRRSPGGSPAPGRRRSIAGSPRRRGSRRGSTHTAASAAGSGSWGRRRSQAGNTESAAAQRGAAPQRPGDGRPAPLLDIGDADNQFGRAPWADRGAGGTSPDTVTLLPSGADSANAAAQPRARIVGLAEHPPEGGEPPGTKLPGRRSRPAGGSVTGVRAGAAATSRRRSEEAAGRRPSDPLGQEHRGSMQAGPGGGDASQPAPEGAPLSGGPLAAAGGVCGGAAAEGADSPAAYSGPAPPAAVQALAAQLAAAAGQGGAAAGGDGDFAAAAMAVAERISSAGTGGNAAVASLMAQLAAGTAPPETAAAVAELAAKMAAAERDGPGSAAAQEAADATAALIARLQAAAAPGSPEAAAAAAAGYNPEPGAAAPADDTPSSAALGAILAAAGGGGGIAAGPEAAAAAATMASLTAQLAAAAGADGAPPDAATVAAVAARIAAAGGEDHPMAAAARAFAAEAAAAAANGEGGAEAAAAATAAFAARVAAAAGLSSEGAAGAVEAVRRAATGRADRGFLAAVMSQTQQGSPRTQPRSARDLLLRQQQEDDMPDWVRAMPEQARAFAMAAMGGAGKRGQDREDAPAAPFVVQPGSFAAAALATARGGAAASGGAPDGGLGIQAPGQVLTDPSGLQGLACGSGSPRTMQATHWGFGDSSQYFASAEQQQTDDETEGAGSLGATSPKSPGVFKGILRGQTSVGGFRGSFRSAATPQLSLLAGGRDPRAQGSASPQADDIATLLGLANLPQHPPPQQAAPRPPTFGFLAALGGAKMARRLASGQQREQTGASVAESSSGEQPPEGRTVTAAQWFQSPGGPSLRTGNMDRPAAGSPAGEARRNSGRDRGAASASSAASPPAGLASEVDTSLVIQSAKARASASSGEGGAGRTLSPQLLQAMLRNIDQASGAAQRPKSVIRDAVRRVTQSGSSASAELPDELLPSVALQGRAGGSSAVRHQDPGTWLGTSKALPRIGARRQGAAGASAADGSPRAAKYSRSRYEPKGWMKTAARHTSPPGSPKAGQPLQSAEGLPAVPATAFVSRMLRASRPAGVGVTSVQQSPQTAGSDQASSTLPGLADAFRRSRGR
eukprot:TRINITY_DN27342_c2_g1_i1.p1 TRINITY_DN27342_c2_g1~~TRINITY_DN27342_c2_g1_i1.p1  ORF type:complete len:2490 (+),score=487.77 TRINITY_DN27342_c2_g1_i1:92-7471(+)